MADADPRPPPSQARAAAVLLLGFFAMVGAFYAFETALEALVLPRICSSPCEAGHGGLRRVALTRHGRASTCLCICADGTEARSKAADNVGDLLPVIAIALVVLVGIIPVAVLAQRSRPPTSPQ